MVILVLAVAVAVFLVGLPLALVACQAYYSENRVAHLLTTRHQLSRTASGLAYDALELKLEWRLVRKRPTLWLCYDLALPETASLVLRAVEDHQDSSGPSQQAAPRDSAIEPPGPGSGTGDPEFDAALRVERDHPDYLTFDRRGLLLRAFADYGAERLENGHLVGAVPVERRPDGIKETDRRIEALKALPGLLRLPPPRNHGSPEAERVTRNRAMLASSSGTLGLTLLVGSTAPLATIPGLSVQAQAFFASCVLTALLMMATSANLFLTHRRALALGKLTQLAGSASVIFSVPFWTVGGVQGLLFCIVSGVLSLVTLNLATQAVSRFPLR